MTLSYSFAPQSSILIVDDLPANVALLKSALGKHYRTKSASSGEEAISAASMEAFDLILLDIMMPGMDGFETLKRLRMIPGYAGTPAMFISASHDEEMERTALSLGAIDFINKPFVIEHIKLRISNTLERTQLQKHFELALDSAELGLWELETSSERVRIDGRRTELFAHNQRKNILETNWKKLCHPDDQIALSAEIARLQQNSANEIDIDIRIRDAEDSWSWIHLFGKASAWGEQGQATKLTGTFRGIQKRKLVEEEKQRSEEQLRLVMEATGEGVWDWVIQKQTVSHNSSWCRILGLDENFLSHNLFFFKSLIHPEDLERVEQALLSSLSQDIPYLCQYRLRKTDGDYVWIEDRGKVVSRSAEGIPLRMLGSIKDISRHKQQEAEIHKLAFYDFLTGLPNRRLLVERMQQAILVNQRKNTHAGIMFIDMDRFKELNDSLGHEAGDQLLIEVAQRLQECIRASDTVARLGGDEFVVMLNELSGEQASAFASAQLVADKILAKLNDPYLFDQQIFFSTPSIGLTFFAGPPSTVQDILKQADDAMYKAKASGRNCIRMTLPETETE